MESKDTPSVYKERLEEGPHLIVKALAPREKRRLDGLTIHRFKNPQQADQMR